MTSTSKVLAGLALLIGLLLALIIWRSNQPSHGAVTSTTSPAPASDASRLTRADTSFLLTAQTNLLGSTDPKISRASLESLRTQLAGMPKAQAIAAIRAFLDSKQDAATHLGFKLANDGSLIEAPTLRTFLLDELARLDPSAAADYAKTILASMDSPDEWAIALRNLIRGDSSADATALAQNKFLQMLQYAPWQQSPSVGYLEAFDVAVQLGGPSLVPPLTGLMAGQDNPAVKHAAYLALDRMVINNPAQTLSTLAADPQSMTGNELARADYFARADVRDAAQKSILESYLLNPQLSAPELQQFAGVFPNANFMISPNLLTQNNTMDHATLTSRDAASLQTVNQWLTDPRFVALRPQLTAIQQRLQVFVAEAAGH